MLIVKGVLLAGIAVGLSAHRYARRHFDHVGVLKTLGATPAQILRGFMSLLLLVGAVAILLGLLAGSLLHVVIVQLLASLIAVELPTPTLRPFLLGGACLLVFGLQGEHHRACSSCPSDQTAWRRGRLHAELGLPRLGS